MRREESLGTGRGAGNGEKEGNRNSEVERAEEAETGMRSREEEKSGGEEKSGPEKREDVPEAKRPDGCARLTSAFASHGAQQHGVVVAVALGELQVVHRDVEAVADLHVQPLHHEEAGLVVAGLVGVEH